MQSPLLAWRDPIYIVAGFAGIVAMALLLVQPLLAAGALPGVPGPRGRRLHRIIGAAVVVAVFLHIGGLWITSPPDVIDVLLLRSPTPFAIWGLAAMWALFGTLALAITRRRWKPHLWRLMHVVFAAIIVGGTVTHAALIEGAMEVITKAILSALLVAANGVVLWGVVAQLWRRSRHNQNRAGSPPP